MGVGGTDLIVIGRGSDPHDLAADGDRLDFAGHAVEHLDSEGGLVQLRA